MTIKFEKWHGNGNDFVIVNDIESEIKINKSFIKKISNRNKGIGFDQLIHICLPSKDNHDFFLRFYNTDGSEAESIISSVKGKGVSYLHSRENKVVKLTVIQSAYLFADDTLTQPSSGAYGEIVGTVKNDSTVVLKNVVGTFDNTGTFSAAIKTFDILLDQRSSYTKGATLSLTDGVNAPIATAEVLEGTTSQNVVQIKVLTGTWIVDDTYFLQSDDLFNTSGTRIVRLTSMSDG